MGYSLKPPPRSGRPDPVPLPPPPQGVAFIPQSKTEPTDDDKRIIRDWIDPQGVIRTGTMQSSVSRGLAIPQGPRPITVRE